MYSWQESLFFHSVAHVGAFLMVEVMQEERVRCDSNNYSLTELLGPYLTSPDLHVWLVAIRLEAISSWALFICHSPFCKINDCWKNGTC